MKKKYKQQNFQKGFSIMEVVLGLFILSLGLIATVVLTTKSIVELNDSRDSLIAAALAQEGSELARNVRDNRAMQIYESVDLDTGAGFDAMFDRFSGTCYIDAVEVHNFIQGTVPTMSCSSGGARLYLDANGFYTHRVVAGNATEFRRVVRFDLGTSGEVGVTSIATWDETPIPTSVANCSASTNCVVDESTLTQWILHK